LLVITGGRDEICYPELGRELYEAAGQPKELWEVPEAEHLGVFAEDSTELVRRMVHCFEQAAER
jgi:fermentation-respiration switch protein FrsA (DUF1100 family)